MKAFGSDNPQDIIPIILKQGQLQVSDLERKTELDKYGWIVFSSSP
jgi:ribosome maturation protein Sdo1